MKNSSTQIIDLLFKRYPYLKCIELDLIDSIQLLMNCYQRHGKLLCCGNGGSAADADHMVGELMKGFILPRPLSEDLKKQIDDDDLSSVLQLGLPAISLGAHTALMTAYANDQLPEAVYAQQVLGYGQPSDVLLCISTSGNSLNCVYAAKTAKAMGLKVISLTGEKTSKLSSLSDVTIQVPATETYQVQELHLPVYHTICLVLENEFFGE